MPNPRPFADYAEHLARLINRTADNLVASASPQDAADRLPSLAGALAKLARCARLEDAFALRLASLAAAPAEAREKAEKARAAARRAIIRTIENDIALAPLHRAEYLLEDFHERLDSALLEADLADRPVNQIIGELRGDLGIPPGPSRPIRRDALDVAILDARARHKPGPYPARTAAEDPAQPPAPGAHHPPAEPLLFRPGTG